MKIVGLIVGMLLGASIGGFGGALAGALLGWIVGDLFAKRNGRADDLPNHQDLTRQLAAAEKSIDELRQRIERLERVEQASPAPAVQPTPAKAEQVSPAPVTSPPPLAAFSNHSAAQVDASAAAQETATGPQRLQSTTELVDSPVPTPSPVPPATETARPSALSVGPAAVTAVAANATSAPGDPPMTRAAPRKPAVPAGPTLIERLLEGNIVAKLGVVILFFGVGFLLKFAYDRGMFPPQLRLLGVAAASVAMFVIGRRLLEKQRTYAIVLMGGAMGLLYLDVFFALKTFALISAPFGFALFAALGVATLLLAVRLDARAFAVLGLTGAFMAPILASTGSGNHVLLFSYYLILNIVILGASWFKSWRELNLVGFVFTFAIALIWGTATYTPAHFATVEPFLIAFFLLYLAIPILFAQRQPPELKGVVDATLVFGMPLSTAMLQAALTRGMGDQILAWSAFAAALVYAALAFALWSRERMRLLAEAHLALAIVFGTAAPYFAFEGYPTFAFWTLEGAAIFWMGCRQNSLAARGFALLLQFAAACYFWWLTVDRLPLGQQPPWLNDRVVGCLLITAASVLTAWFMKRFAADVTRLEVSMQGPLIGWGGAWLLFGALIGICGQWHDDLSRLPALLVATAAACALAEGLGSVLAWPILRLAARAHAFMIGVLLLLWLLLLPDSHPMQAAGVWAWPLVFAVYFFVLHRQCADGIEASSGWRFAAGWTLLLLVATWEVLWRYDAREFVWVWAIGAGGLIAAALRFRLREFAAGMPAIPARAGLSNLPLWWSLVWWFAGLHGVIEQRIAAEHQLAVHLASVALSVLCFEAAGSALQWAALRRAQCLLSLAMLLAALDIIGHSGHPFAGAQFMSWAVAVVVGTLTLRRQAQDGLALMPAPQHLFAWWLALALMLWDAHWRIEHAGLGESWLYAATGAIAAAWLALTTMGIERRVGAFGDHSETFRKFAAWPLIVGVFIWTLAANTTCNGSLPPLPYIPVFNALDLAQLALLGAGVRASRSLVNDAEAKRILPMLFAAAAFFWVNAVLLRSVHQWTDVPFALHALLRSVVAQAALSLLWTSVALVLMTIAIRRVSRPLWMAGAALLAMVVFKLFVNDLGNTGTVARIVSFIGVGVLLLVIGYVAPVPPRAATIADVKEDA